MRTILFLTLVWAWTSIAWAKTVKIPKGSIEVNQLHDELLARFQEWRGTKQADGTYVKPLLRVEHTDQEIRLAVPDDADEAAVQAVVAAHTPRPRRTAAGSAPNGSETAIRELEKRIEQLESRVNTREPQDTRGRQP